MTQLTDAEIAGYGRGAQFAGNDLVIFVAVALAESGGRTNAINANNKDGSVDRGLMQINSVHAALLATGDVFDPADNARMAHVVWASSGWRAWSTYNNGAYLPFMGRGLAVINNPAIMPVISATPVTPSAANGGANIGSLISSSSTWTRIVSFLVGLALIILVLRRMAR